MELTGFFRDPVTSMRHILNHSAETNYFYSTVVGELTYSEAHSHCKGTYGSIGPNHMSNLFVTENLEVTKKIVTIRENFHNRDMMVLENRAYIPATLRQGQGIVTDFRTLLLKKRRVPCQWKKVRDIIAVRIERTKGAGTMLVDDDQHIYIQPST